MENTIKAGSIVELSPAGKDDWCPGIVRYISKYSVVFELALYDAEFTEDVKRVAFRPLQNNEDKEVIQRYIDGNIDNESMCSHFYYRQHPRWVLRKRTAFIVISEMP